MIIIAKFYTSDVCLPDAKNKVKIRQEKKTSFKLNRTQNNRKEYAWW